MTSCTEERTTSLNEKWQSKKKTSVNRPVLPHIWGKTVRTNGALFQLLKKHSVYGLDYS
jgi:hypothetical protein